MNTAQNSESPLVSNRDTAPAYWLLDALWVILADGEQSGGRFSIMEQWKRGPGPGPPLHVHGFSEEVDSVMSAFMQNILSSNSFCSYPGLRKRYVLCNSRIQMMTEH
jgi:hypothetical protein